MSEQWYFVRAGKKLGPVSADELNAALQLGELNDNDAVWTEGLPGWTRLGQVRDRIAPNAAPSTNPLGFETVDLGLDRPREPAKKLPPKSYPMGLGDRIARALFVGAAVGLGWGIRGDFGHMLGAMYPGAVLMLALAYVSGQDSLLRSMPTLALASAFGIGLGGNMSYGLLHGYAQADTFKNYSYGFFTLFLEGGAWGVYGGALVGMLLERERATWIDWIGGIAVMIFSAMFLWVFVYKIIGFDINPVRSNDALAHIGGGIGLLVWFAIRKRPIALRASMLGFIGFGLGMSVGRLIGNTFHDMEGMFTINHWNTMEMSCGFIGGFVFAIGMLGMQFRDRKSDANLTPSDIAGVVFVLGLIPFLHRLTRLTHDRTAELKQNLQSYASTWTLDTVLTALDVVVVIGLIGAGIWMYLRMRDAERWHAFPVLWLSFVMVLFDDFFSLYFSYPAQPNHVDTRSFFWVLFAILCGYVAVREYLGGHSDECDTEEESDRVPWKPWCAVTVAAFALVVLLAGAVNGKTTMQNAATRWPVWAWNDKPNSEPPFKN